MSDVVSRPHDDKVLPYVVYALYLLAPFNGLTAVIGLILAYVSRPTAGPVTESHYTFLVRTFWLSIGWCLIGLALVLVGVPLLIVLIGVPVMLAGALILGVIGLWFVVRCVVGLVFLSRGEAYPRPRSWLI
ncbi:MAG: hypothetical protein JWP92_2024 [Caulobacter sp.]|nr:hypothetical protein [Caulobacter sp.]